MKSPMIWLNYRCILLTLLLSPAERMPCGVLLQKMVYILVCDPGEALRGVILFKYFIHDMGIALCYLLLSTRSIGDGLCNGVKLVKCSVATCHSRPKTSNHLFEECLFLENLKQ